MIHVQITMTSSGSIRIKVLRALNSGLSLVVTDRGDSVTDVPSCFFSETTQVRQHVNFVSLKFKIMQRELAES